MSEAIVGHKKKLKRRRRKKKSGLQAARLDKYRRMRTTSVLAPRGDWGLEVVRGQGGWGKEGNKE
jgi:hypothetical protein